MFVEFLSLTDFRSYRQLDVELTPGVTVFVGHNGLGKTNIVEAVGYLASMSSHRVSSDVPLIHFGAERALVRARLRRGSQGTAVEMEINAAKSNRARINRANPIRARDALGICRTVLFAPEDLALVKGDPSNRRRFLDDLLVSLVPRHAATRSDYERVLKQRNALLKSARASGKFTEGHQATLDVWNQHMAVAGAQLLRARLDLVHELQPHIARAYNDLTDGSKLAGATYKSTIQTALGDDGAVEEEVTESADDLYSLSVDQLTEMYLAAFEARKRKELDRGVSLVGPHRDELELVLGEAPAKGYASHGETWSMALSLRLASYYVFLADDETPGSAPILILDDVFAELDVQRRTRLAAIVATAEQVLVTAAVVEDVPAAVDGRRIRVIAGGLSDDE